MTGQDWYRENNCDHAHCPYECENPQPFIDQDVMYCGKCFHDSLGSELVEMIPCRPDTCVD